MILITSDAPNGETVVARVEVLGVHIARKEGQVVGVVSTRVGSTGPIEAAGSCNTESATSLADVAGGKPEVSAFI